MSALAAGMAWSYVKGGETWRIAHQSYVASQRVAAAQAEARWEIERRNLMAQVSIARALAQSAVAVAESSDADVEQKIEAAVKSAKSAPMDADVVARLNAIIMEANR